MKPDQTIDREAFATFVDTAGTGLQAFESDEDPDLVEIDREHVQFESGETPLIAFWQNHAKHLEGHFAFMKRDYGRYDRWPKAAQAAFVDHMRQTVKAVDNLAAMAAQAAQGPPPPLEGGDQAEAGAGGGAGPGQPPNLHLMQGGGGGGGGAGAEDMQPPAPAGPPGGQGPPVPAGQQPALQPADFRAAAP